MKWKNFQALIMIKLMPSQSLKSNSSNSSVSIWVIHLIWFIDLIHWFTLFITNMMMMIPLILYRIFNSLWNYNENEMIKYNAFYILFYFMHLIQWNQMQCNDSLQLNTFEMTSEWHAFASPFSIPKVAPLRLSLSWYNKFSLHLTLVIITL